MFKEKYIDRFSSIIEPVKKSKYIINEKVNLITYM